MIKTILIAPKSFKECADSIETANLFYAHLSKNSKLKLIKLPISDGGDGFLEVCKANFNLVSFHYEVSAPNQIEKLNIEVGYDRKSKNVYVESAMIVGLKVIPINERHPVNLNTKGIGELLSLLNDDVTAGRLEINKVILGIGGTGTNDLAIGAASECGLILNDTDGNFLLPFPRNFSRTENLVWQKPKLSFEIEVIVDVENPLLGEQGATKVFGRQKGSTESELNEIELGFGKIYNILKNKKLASSLNPSSGAGGGLAAGLCLFFDATVITASEFVLGYLKLSNLLEQADYIITGEGAFDLQSLMRKGPGIILEHANGKEKKVFLVCGKIEDDARSKLADNVIIIELSKYFNSIEESIKKFKDGIILASEEILSHLK